MCALVVWSRRSTKSRGESCSRYDDKCPPSKRCDVTRAALRTGDDRDSYSHKSQSPDGNEINGAEKAVETWIHFHRIHIGAEVCGSEIFDVERVWGRACEEHYDPQYRLDTGGHHGVHPDSEYASKLGLAAENKVDRSKKNKGNNRSHGEDEEWRRQDYSLRKCCGDLHALLALLRRKLCHLFFSF